jgi:hypothetical protein
MVLYSLSAKIPQWRKCGGENAKYAYLATHFLARFFASGANLVAAAGHAPLPARDLEILVQNAKKEFLLSGC